MDCSKVEKLIRSLREEHKLQIETIEDDCYITFRHGMKQEKLRVGVQNGVLRHWKTLTPAYPQFHEDDKTASLLRTEYADII